MNEFYRLPPDGSKGQEEGVPRTAERASSDRESEQTPDDEGSSLAFQVHAAHWGPPPGLEQHSPAAEVTVAPAEAVQRFSFAGDGQVGTARIVLKDGVMAGSPVLVRVDGRAVRISGARDAAGEAWTARICARLRHRGYDAEPE